LQWPFQISNFGNPYPECWTNLGQVVTHFCLLLYVAKVFQACDKNDLMWQGKLVQIFVSKSLRRGGYNLLIGLQATVKSYYNGALYFLFRIFEFSRHLSSLFKPNLDPKIGVVAVVAVVRLKVKNFSTEISTYRFETGILRFAFLVF